AAMGGRSARVRPACVGVAEPARGDRAAGDVCAHRTGRERQLGPRNRRAPAAPSSVGLPRAAHRLVLARPLPAAASAPAGVARTLEPGGSLQSFPGSDILRATTRSGTGPSGFSGRLHWLASRRAGGPPRG